jgi:hypothetical protein
MKINFKKIRELSQARTLCEKDYIKKKNKSVEIFHPLGNINQIFNYADYIDDALEFVSNYHSFIYSGKPIFLHHDTIQHFFGNRSEDYSKRLKAMLLTVIDHTYIVGKRPMSYRVQLQDLFRFLESCNLFYIPLEDRRLINKELEQADWKQMPVCKSYIQEFFSEYFYKKEFDKILSKEESIEYVEHSDHFRMYNKYVQMPKVIKNHILGNANFYDVDISSAIFTLIPQFTSQICENPNISKRDDCRNNLLKINQDIKSFNFFDMKSELASIIADYFNESAAGNTKAKELMNALMCGARMTSRAGAVMSIIEDEYELFYILLRNKNFTKCRQLMRTMWNVIYFFFERHTGFENFATETKKQIKKRNKKIMERYEILIDKPSNTQEDIDNLIIARELELMAPPKITKRARFKIYMWLEKQVMDIVSNYVSTEHKEAVLMREHDGFKCSILPDVKAIIELVKSKLNFNINFKVTELFSNHSYLVTS